MYSWITCEIVPNGFGRYILNIVIFHQYFVELELAEIVGEYQRTPWRQMIHARVNQRDMIPLDVEGTTILAVAVGRRIAENQIKLTCVAVPEPFHDIILVTEMVHPVESIQFHVLCCPVKVGC